MASGRQDSFAVEINKLHRNFGRTEAVGGLSLRVRPGSCYGLFGRNGAGKTTTIKCMLGHLRPTSGNVVVFGFDPRRNEVGVKWHVGYVPETIGFYPWMSAQNMLDYAASFRPYTWDFRTQNELLVRFGLDPRKKIRDMSKGMRAQLSLICAIAAAPDLLLLDEPTSGLDPIVRREFIETVIGAYQEAAPDRRTVFVSTHLIGEWEGLIDEFTIMDRGREMISMRSDDARERYRRVRLRFPEKLPELPKGGGILSMKPNGRSIEVLTDSYGEEFIERMKALSPEEILDEPLSLEEIFVATGQAAWGVGAGEAGVQ